MNIRRLVAALLTVVVLLVPVVPAGAETTVTVKDNIIKITMTVDVVGAADKHPTAPDGTPLVDYWNKILQDTWGAAFDRLPYKDCFKLELDVKLNARKADFDAKDGNHRIIVAAASGGSFEGTGFEGTPETSRNSRTGDGTRSFERDRDGAIPEDAPPTVVAHEFGHLFGLGDDNKNGVAKNGRDGTMMVGGVPGIDLNVVQKIDQNLIDRIGKAITKHLEKQGKKLPKCETWKGPLRSTGEYSGPCTGTSEGTLTVGVVGDSASGTASLTGSYTCPAIGVSGGGTGTADVRGTFTGDEFELLPKVAVLTSGDNIGDCLGIPKRPIVVPVTERGTAKASFAWSIATAQYTCDITLERQRDDEAVG